MINKTRNIKNVIYFLIVTLWMPAFEGISNAATYYVSSGGTTTWTQCTNINTPCSAITAMANAVAGDIVYFRGGTYTLGQSVEMTGVLQPSNSGTSGNPITFKAYPAETPIMDATAVANHDNSRALGNGDKDYIIFDGFTIQANGGVKRGGLIITGENRGYDVVGCQVLNCTFNGGSTICPTNDNREVLRLDSVQDTLIKGNLFYNVKSTRDYPTYPTGSNEAHAAILMYHNTRTTIENNEIRNCAGGIYAKSITVDNIYRYNYIHDCYQAIYITTYTTAADRNADGTKIYHNVITNNTFSGINTYPSETAHSNDETIYNNTIYNSVRNITYGQSQAAHGAVIYNNIGQTNKYDLYGNMSSYLAEEDYNQFGTGGIIIDFYHNVIGEQYFTTLASWQASTTLESGGHPGTGDLASDPLFQNGSGNFNQLNDFKLAPNSPCKGAGKGGVDMGANIDLVGVRNSSEQKIPAHPGNLK